MAPTKNIKNLLSPWGQKPDDSPIIYHNSIRNFSLRVLIHEKRRTPQCHTIPLKTPQWLKTKTSHFKSQIFHTVDFLFRISYLDLPKGAFHGWSGVPLYIYIYTPSLRVQTAPELEDAGRSFSGWWFQIFFIFTPIPGEMIQFDLRIFFRWVGEKTTNQFLVSPRKRFHPFNISLTSTPPPSTDGTLKKSVESAAQLTNWNQKRSFWRDAERKHVN